MVLARVGENGADGAGDTVQPALEILSALEIRAGTAHSVSDIRLACHWYMVNGGHIVAVGTHPMLGWTAHSQLWGYEAAARLLTHTDLQG